MDEILNEVFNDVKGKLDELMDEYQRAEVYFSKCVVDYDMDEYQEFVDKLEAKLAALGLLLSSVNTEDLKKKIYSDAFGK